MAARIKGVNTGVIHRGSEFIALALKVKTENDSAALFFIPALALRDIFISLEYGLHQQTLSAPSAQEASRHMADNIPPLAQEEMVQGAPGQRICAVEPDFSRKGEIGLTLLAEDGKSAALALGTAQIPLFITAISRAIQNAGMHALSLRLSSLLDFLPLYDADFRGDTQLEYDTYTHPAWKLALFDRTLALVYHYTDEQGRERSCGTIVKTRSPSDDERMQAIARRLLAFSPKLKKLEGERCRVSVRALGIKEGEPSLDDCLKALCLLRGETTAAA
ncbi:hypothetical protein RJ492_001953 [Pluralibacter gergoviae]|uniref:Uncharacterized protein n=1 Tax=Pluralibacter gergoviae TaxID=61647 RepID=A0AAI9DNY5_PLUGE|nr:YjeJ family protein [Pluralibacter gergoviae]EKV0916907.1 hypothetical protein [Pluralibacter gergoviae]EKV9909712.1 hypothetical protein [Pluralibacter gergoviae]EKW7275799.1 hypothetical protein [Pluralibacter gergoviae]ELD4296197.1 hypothetical protein [Pluralibacter gergoviae]ELD4306698.1 hypothetical protein [Pluralibacter gergoviae]